MSDEHDSWFKDAFGLDVGEAVGKIKDEASAMVEDAKNKGGQVVQGIKKAVEGGVDGVVSGIAGTVAKAASGAGAAVAGAAKKAAEAAAAVLALLRARFRSTGRSAVVARTHLRTCLRCKARLASPPMAIAVLRPLAPSKRFSGSWGSPRPDGRVDAGGATERALRGGAILRPHPSRRRRPPRPTRPDRWID